MLWMAAPIAPVCGQTVSHVIHISVDGLRPDAVTTLGPANAPNFYRLRTQGAFTDNARTDCDYTITLPNHTCQLTGYPVSGTNGHNWTYNADAGAGITLALNKGNYVPGVFDVTHDHGLRTGLFASKSKFLIYTQSWDAVSGAPDLIVPDNGPNKIDFHILNTDTTQLVNCLITNMTAQPFHYVFLHLCDPDLNGHYYGWDVTPGTPYSNAVKLTDTYLGALFAMIDSSPQLSNHTAIVLTADHGGVGFDHTDPLPREDYTIPFYVWGPPVSPDEELYGINPANRKDPVTARPDYSEYPQPIRNGDAANLILMLLGLESVTGSSINAAQNLSIVAPFREKFRLSLADNGKVFTFFTRTNLRYDIESSSDLNAAVWQKMVSNIPGNGGRVTNTVPHSTGLPQEFFRLLSHP